MTLTKAVLFWFQWLLVSAIGIVIGGLLVSVAYKIFPMLILNNLSRFTLLAVTVTAIGTVIGTSQWLILQRWVSRRTWWWILATGVGWLIGWFAAGRTPWIKVEGSPLFHLFWMTILDNGEVAIVGNYSASGIMVWFAIIGITQWFVLRKWVHGAIWWIPFRSVVAVVVWSIAASMITATMILGPPNIGTEHTLRIAPVALGGASILSEATIGILLAWLLRYPVTREKQPTDEMKLSSGRTLKSIRDG